VIVDFVERHEELETYRVSLSMIGERGVVLCWVRRKRGGRCYAEKVDEAALAFT
jgi:hypothetical protein